MKEDLKNKIILVLSLLTIIFFIYSIISYKGEAKQKILLDRERRVRMGLEEKVLNLYKQNTDLQQNADQLKEMFVKESSAHETDSKVLNQEIEELKKELEKVTKLKEQLEADLGEALISQDIPR